MTTVISLLHAPSINRWLHLTKENICNIKHTSEYLLRFNLPFWSLSLGWCDGVSDLSTNNKSSSLSLLWCCEPVWGGRSCDSRLFTDSVLCGVWYAPVSLFPPLEVESGLVSLLSLSGEQLVALLVEGEEVLKTIIHMWASSWAYGTIT